MLASGDGDGSAATIGTIGNGSATICSLGAAASGSAASVSAALSPSSGAVASPESFGSGFSDLLQSFQVYVFFAWRVLCHHILQFLREGLGLHSFERVARLAQFLREGLGLHQHMLILDRMILFFACALPRLYHPEVSTADNVSRAGPFISCPQEFSVTHSLEVKGNTDK